MPLLNGRLVGVPGGLNTSRCCAARAVPEIVSARAMSTGVMARSGPLRGEAGYAVSRADARRDIFARSRLSTGSTTRRNAMADTRGRIRWVLVFWMFVLSAVAYLDRVNLSIAGRFVAQEFGLSNVQLRTVFSSFILGYALFQAPGGRLADRFGPRWVLFVGVLWWSVFTALTGWLPSGFSGALAALLLVRFLLGVGEAVVYPASNRAIASWIPMSERGIANGILFAGVGVGAGVATPLVTKILALHGWRWSFFACSF